MSNQVDIPAMATLVIGAGHFGTRAAQILSRRDNSSVVVVDIDKKRLSCLNGLGVRRISCDGIQFLLENFEDMDPSTTIVPAVPVHLAFEWLKKTVHPEYAIEQLAEPGPDELPVPNAWRGSDGSVLVSYADFLCPDDCPEPEFCTVTGKRRERSMYSLLGRLVFTGYRVHVLRSHQLAPGLGGYKISGLVEALGEITGENSPQKWLLATACKCHGVVTAFEIRSQKVFSREKGRAVHSHITE